MRQNTKILGTGNDELVKDYEDASGLATQMKRVDEETSSYADTDREDDESSYAGSIRGERVLNASVVFDMVRKQLGSNPTVPLGNTALRPSIKLLDSRHRQPFTCGHRRHACSWRPHEEHEETLPEPLRKGTLDGMLLIRRQTHFQLQDTAFFLEQLLERVEQSEGNKSLINKIRGLQLDLDQSMGEADAATKDIQRMACSVYDIMHWLL